MSTNKTPCVPPVNLVHGDLMGPCLALIGVLVFTVRWSASDTMDMCLLDILLGTVMLFLYSVLLTL